VVEPALWERILELVGFVPLTGDHLLIICGFHAAGGKASDVDRLDGAADGLMDPRTPRPDPRLRVAGGVAAAAAAAAVYVLALTVDVLPPPSMAVTMFVLAPVFAVLALVMLWARRHESRRPDLGWFVTGLAVGVVAMILQLASFPAVAAGGGPLGTTQTSNAALYVAFHAAATLGALLGAWGAPARARSWFFVVGVGLCVALAWDVVPLPSLIESGRFTPALIGTEVALSVVTAGSTIWWLVRGGSSARPLVAWVGISQSLAVYDLVLNAAGGERFDAIWWASLSMRVASYGVLALGSLVSLLGHLRRVERYASEELDRREGQLERSLRAVRKPLDEATRASATLKEQLLPRQLSPPETVQIAARYAGAGPDKELGGDWYDVIALPDGGLALVIGDVEGHDLAAAAVMGQVRAAVHSYALEGHPPAVVLENVNRFIVASGINRFVALAYLQLYPGDRLMTIAVAGNPPPVVVRHCGETPTALPVTIGPPLGLEEGRAWQERTLRVPDGADLALFSDGVLGGVPWDASVAEPFPVSMPASSESDPSPVDLLADTLISGARDDDAAVLAARIAVGQRTAAERTLPVRPISAPIARVWLDDLVDVWLAAGDLVDSPDLRDKAATAVLLLTELVSNALRHGEDAIRVRVELAGTRLLVDVSDTGHRMPTLRAVGATETSGRGLRLVESLSDEWGVHVQDRGKSVWFALDLEGAPPEEEDLLAAFGLGEEDFTAS
jgi:hypothetical protein